MSFGMGNIQFVSNQNSFGMGAANNGTSVDSTSGKITLGDNGGGEAALTKPRNITTNGQSIFFQRLQGSGEKTTIQAGSLSTQDQNGTRSAALLGALGQISIAETLTDEPTLQFIVSTILNRVHIVNRGNGTLEFRNDAGTAKFFFDILTGEFDAAGPITATGNISNSAGGLNIVGNGVIAGTIQSANPNGAGSAGAWMLGKKKAGAVALDAANYIEVNIGGTVIKLGIVV